MARQAGIGAARFVTAWFGLVWQAGIGVAWRGAVGLGLAWQAWIVAVWFCKDRSGKAGMDSQGETGSGKERIGRHGAARLGLEAIGLARQEW